MNSSLMNYSMYISAVCNGNVNIVARSEEEAKKLAKKAEIRFDDWYSTDVEVINVSESWTNSSHSELIPAGYNKVHVTKPLILTPEKWTPGEWKTLCKLTGGLPAERTQRIAIHTDQIQSFISDKSAIIAPAAADQREIDGICADGTYANYNVHVSALCYGIADVVARSEEEAKSLVKRAEIEFSDWDNDYEKVTTTSRIRSDANRREAIPAGYSKSQVTEPLILEPEDWTFEEWETLCKLAGGLPAVRTQKIVIPVNSIETWVSGESEAAVPASTNPEDDAEERTYIVTEMCPHCMSEITMRWNTDTMGFKAFCPACGERLMLCDECRHLPDAKPCDYSSESDTCRYNDGKCSEHCQYGSDI